MSHSLLHPLCSGFWPLSHFPEVSPAQVSKALPTLRPCSTGHLSGHVSFLQSTQLPISRPEGPSVCAGPRNGNFPRVGQEAEQGAKVLLSELSKVLEAVLILSSV